MKIVRFLSGGKVHLGKQLDERSALRIEGDLFGQFSVTDQKLPLEKLLAPLVPVDILCIGLNYREHALETKAELPRTPLLFIKAGNTLNNPLDPIVMPRLSKQIDYEGELAVVIGKAAKDVKPEEALNYVLGYTIGNDVTARDWQKDKSLGGGQFARGKSFDGFCPLGPCIVTTDEIPNPNSLKIKTILNGSVMQDDTTGDMIFSVAHVISSLSSTMTLRPGAVVLTGTPRGVGMGRMPPVWMKAGDKIAVEIQGIGRLENPVANAV
ncbi:MAG: fumarylacetoacetate hydrolase family protein [Planctomycetota bacterium]|nr:fumarylacetoacetate hydrolase family protein [Planctomycetota bacterium]